MWYNNEVDAKSIYYADSPDLFTWTDKGKAVGERQGEGPVVFRWKGRNWMIVDVWSGLGVYHSDDFINWVRQPENLVEQPGRGLDDQVIGRHAGVAIDANDRAYLFYFTHPGHHLAPNNADGYFNRRSSIQVVEMKLEDGKLVADRDAPTYINLGTPRQGARTR